MSTFMVGRLGRGPGRLRAAARAEAVAHAQEREVQEGHRDLAPGELGRVARAVLEVDGHLGQAERGGPKLRRGGARALGR